MSTLTWIGLIAGFVSWSFLISHVAVVINKGPYKGQHKPDALDYLFFGPLSCALVLPGLFFIPDAIRGFRQRFFEEDESNEHPKSVTQPGGITVTTTEESESEPEPDQSSEPLTGFRQWRLFETEDGRLVLASSICPFIYDGPVVSVDAEEVKHGKGLHAAKDGDKFYDPKPHLPVEGEVELFGRVVEGRRGYRAERLRIESLTLYPGGWTEHTDASINKRTDPITGRQITVHPSRAAPENARRQFKSSSSTETPWPHPFTDLAKRLEDRYRCDVEIGEREGSPILDKSRNGDSPTQTNFYFVQKPSETEIAKYSSGGELWTPRAVEENDNKKPSQGGFTIPIPHAAYKTLTKTTMQNANTKSQHLV